MHQLPDVWAKMFPKAMSFSLWGNAIWLLVMDTQFLLTCVSRPSLGGIPTLILWCSSQLCHGCPLPFMNHWGDNHCHHNRCTFILSILSYPPLPYYFCRVGISGASSWLLISSASQEILKALRKKIQWLHSVEETLGSIGDLVEDLGHNNTSRPSSKSPISTCGSFHRYTWAQTTTGRGLGRWLSDRACCITLLFSPPPSTHVKAIL